MSTDVVIVGGGLSGLSAAKYLLDHGASVVLVEARDRFGGRTCTEEFEGGLKVDVGGAYVGPTQDRLLRLSRQLGVSTYPVYTAGDNVLELNHSRSSYTGTIPKLLPHVLLDVNKLLCNTEKQRKRVPAEAPWLSNDAMQLDSRTVQNFIDDQAWTDSAKTLYSAAVKAILCAEPAEISFLYWLFYIQSGQGVMRLSEVDNGAQERKFKGGSQQLSNLLAARLKKEYGDRFDVRLSSAVRKIDNWNSKMVTVWIESTHTSSASSSSSFLQQQQQHEQDDCMHSYCQLLDCKRVILAVSPTLYPKISFSPSLPGPKLQLSQRLPMGSIIKTTTFYSQPFWRTLGSSGSLLSDEGPVIYTMDDCQMDFGYYAIMGFILADSAREWSSKTSLDRQEAVCRQYARLFNSDLALRPIRYVEKNWSEDEWSGGCYVGFMGPGVMTTFGKHIREPFGNVHVAGTETATTWCGYMDGAIQAGERAAHEILDALATGDNANIISPGEFCIVEPQSEDVVPKPNGPSKIEMMLPGLGCVIVSLIIVLAAIAGALFWYFLH